MSKIGGLIEGCIVVALGLAMTLLVRADNYWLYLHPKFKWLTLTAGIILVLVGATALLYNRRPNLARIIVFLVFSTLASIGYFLPNPTSSATSGPPEESASKKESRIALNGREYIKINLGELYGISARGLEEKRAARYVTRGIVKRNPELDEIGQFVLVRVFIWCCFADAVAVGFRVQGDQPEKFPDGQWVRVFGKLQGLPSSQSAEPTVQVKGILAKALHKTDGIFATRVEKIEPPPIPFMFEFRKSEPYAY